MTTTTTNCPICEDSGVIHKELNFAYTFEQCSCKPPGHWMEQSDRVIARLEVLIEEAEKIRW
jgi:hypothetical protein